jgi:hypothetical protein
MLLLREAKELIMIISHQHKYLFVELPLTGSTAIHDELCTHYAGIPILKKHSTYRDFCKVATPEEKQYFVFAGIRHPLDQVVSHYFKFKTGHHGQFTSEVHLRRLQESFWHRLAYEYSHLQRYRFVQQHNVDFATFFLRFYRVPYSNWSLLDHERFDFIIHFEQLAADFAQLIERLGLQLVQPLPVANKTDKKATDFLAYYNTPAVRNRAKRVFGPFMQQWGYTFPAEWGETQPSWWHYTEFAFYNLFRQVYWRYLRYPAVSAKGVALETTRTMQVDTQRRLEIPKVES